jgi:hypothetical protein
LDRIYAASTRSQSDIQTTEIVKGVVSNQNQVFEINRLGVGGKRFGIRSYSHWSDDHARQFGLAIDQLEMLGCDLVPGGSIVTQYEGVSGGGMRAREIVVECANPVQP